MAKLQMPNDRQSILWIIFDRVLGLEANGQKLAIPKQGDPRLLSHQLGLQGEVDDASVRLGVNELIDTGKIVVSEPAWVDTTQPEGSQLESRVLYASAVV